MVVAGAIACYDGLSIFSSFFCRSIQMIGLPSSLLSMVGPYTLAHAFSLPSRRKLSLPSVTSATIRLLPAHHHCQHGSLSFYLFPFLSPQSPPKFLTAFSDGITPHHHHPMLCSGFIPPPTINRDNAS